MYSMILFIVETSLSGFFGSGCEADVGGGEDADHVLVRDPARELDALGRARARPQAPSSARRRRPRRRRSRASRRACGAAPQAPRAHGRRRPGGPSRRGTRAGTAVRAAGPSSAATARKRSASGALRTTKTSSGPLPAALDRDTSIRLVRAHDDVREPERHALGDVGRALQAPRGRRIGTRTARERDRGGRRRLRLRACAAARR